jgi:hypothetical protein
VLFQVEGRDEAVLRPGDVFFEPAGVPIAHFDALGDDLTFLAYFMLSQVSNRRSCSPTRELTTGRRSPARKSAIGHRRSRASQPAAGSRGRGMACGMNCRLPGQLETRGISTDRTSGHCGNHGSATEPASQGGNSTSECRHDHCVDARPLWTVCQQRNRRGMALRMSRRSQ